MPSSESLANLEEAGHGDNQARVTCNNDYTPSHAGNETKRQVAPPLFNNEVVLLPMLIGMFPHWYPSSRPRLPMICNCPRCRFIQ